VSIVWVPFSVTARMRPFGLKATSAPLAAELDKARGRVRDADEGVRTGDPKRLDRVRALVQDVHEQAPDGDAYRSVPDTRDVGEVQAISLDSNRDTPALTTSRSSPSAVIAIDAWLPNPMGVIRLDVHMACRRRRRRGGCDERAQRDGLRNHPEPGEMRDATHTEPPSVM
jgi:hypothetical protein